MHSVFHAPAAIYTGGGCRAQLSAALSAEGISKLLVVTDPFVRSSAMLAEILEQLATAEIATTVFSNVQPDPTDKNVAEGVLALQQSGAQGILAVGGGSPIDAAKTIAIASSNPGPLRQFQGYFQVVKAGPPVIAMPTTAGTGSEATKVAVITDTERDVKMMMLDSKLMPRMAFVDYELTMGMPAALTAHVGVDTLTHGIEAFVSKKANAMTEGLASSAITKSAAHLRRAWAEPGDRRAREAMALAALHGGMAFTNSSVCLVHGMSRPLGAVFHIPHGLSNAVLLPAVTRYSLPSAPAAYAQVARLMGLATAQDGDAFAGQALVEGLYALNAELRVPTLREVLDKSKNSAENFQASLAKMATDALASGSPGNNPRVPLAEEIVALYETAYSESW